MPRELSYSIFICSFFVLCTFPAELKSSPDKWDAGCPLLDACVRGDHEQVRQLLSREDELHRTDPSGKTALHYACQFGWKDIVHLLIQKSLKPSAIDDEGNSCLHIACQYGHSDIVDYILSLHVCDVNAINAMGDTPLHLACQIGSVSIAMKLMTTGEIDYKVVNNDGLLALDMAGESSSVRNHLLSCIQKIEEPFTPITKVYLLGSNSSGKSTLVNGLRRRLEVDNITDLPEAFMRNRGVVPVSFRSHKLKYPFLICKFPGNHQFYINQMPNYVSSHPQLFIITVDISCPIEEVKKNVTFWMSQIEKHYPSYAMQIIVIASHPDKIDSATLHFRQETMQSLLKSYHVLFVKLLDTSTPEYQTLLICLSECFANVVPKTNIAYPVAIFGSLITEVFGSSESVDLEDIISYIKRNDDVPLPTSKEGLHQILSSLSRNSDVIHLSLSNEESWIIVNILKYLEMLLTHERPPTPSDLATSFLCHLGFRSLEFEGPTGQ